MASVLSSAPLDGGTNITTHIYVYSWKGSVFMDKLKLPNQTRSEYWETLVPKKAHVCKRRVIEVACIKAVL